MRIAILTFDGFNEIDSFVAFNMLNRVKRPGWRAEIACPAPVVTSMNGLKIERQQPLEFAAEADAVLVGSGVRTREIITDNAVMDSLRLDPTRQLVAAQCSGALVLAKLSLLSQGVACTDSVTKPWVIEAGIRVLEQPLHAAGNVATAGGCLASHYLAGWLIAKGAGLSEAEPILHYVAPMGEKDAYTRRALAVIGPQL